MGKNTEDSSLCGLGTAYAKKWMSPLLSKKNKNRDSRGNGIPNSRGNPMGMGIRLQFGNGNGRMGRNWKDRKWE